MELVVNDDPRLGIDPGDPTVGNVGGAESPILRRVAIGICFEAVAVLGGREPPAGVLPLDLVDCIALAGLAFGEIRLPSHNP